jgi:hypothetical protein
VSWISGSCIDRTSGLLPSGHLIFSHDLAFPGKEDYPLFAKGIVVIGIEVRAIIHMQRIQRSVRQAEPYFEVDPLPARIRDFLSKHYVYFLNDAFLDNELNELTGLAREVATDLNRQVFESYKKLLEAQAEALNTA